MLQIVTTNEQKVKVTAAPLTQSGKPATIDGALKVTVQSGDATVVQDPNEPLSFFAISGDTPGTSEILVEADADLGAGVVTIQDVVQYVVSGAQAAAVGLTVGTPEPK